MTSKLTVGEFLSIVSKFHAETATITNFNMVGGSTLDGYCFVFPD